MASILGWITLLPQLPMLTKATSDDSTPTPGYTMEEICALTFSSAKMCTELLEYLLSRLRKKSPHTKAKTLRIMKYLIEKGHESFRRDLQRQTGDLREATSFRGQPDPMQGEALNIFVRKTANEVLEALFAPQETTAPRQPPRSNTFGSSNYGNGSTSSDSTSGPPARKYEGFGSSDFRGGDQQQGGGGFMSKVKSAIGDISDRIGSNSSKSPAASGYVPASDPYISPSSYSSPSYSSSYNSSYTAPRSVASEQHSDITTDSDFEARLVDEITAPGGVRAGPAPAQLNQFLTRCATLDCRKVADLLDDKLSESEQDKIRLRALYVIEALATSDIPRIRDCLAVVRPAVMAMTTSSLPATRQKAEKVIQILNGVAPSDTGVVDLGEPAPQSLLISSSAPPPAATPATTASMFEGLNFGEPKREIAAPSASGLGFFSGMSIGTTATTSAPAPAPVAAPLLQPNAASLIGDTFGGSAAPKKPVQSDSLLWEEPTVQVSFDPLLGLSSAPPSTRAAPTHAPAPVPTLAPTPIAATAPSMLQPSSVPLQPTLFSLSTPTPTPAAPTSYAPPPTHFTPTPSYGTPSHQSGLGAFAPAPSAFLPASSFQPSAPAAQGPSVFDSRPAGARSGSLTKSSGGGGGFEFMKQKDAFNFVADEVGKSRK